MITRKYILPNGTPSFIITAVEGKTLIRKSDGFDFGPEVHLGYRYAGGEKILEVPEDFEEQDIEKDLTNFNL